LDEHFSVHGTVRRRKPPALPAEGEFEGPWEIDGNLAVCGRGKRNKKAKGGRT